MLFYFDVVFRIFHIEKGFYNRHFSFHTQWDTFFHHIKISYLMGFLHQDEVKQNNKDNDFCRFFLLKGLLFNIQHRQRSHLFFSSYFSRIKKPNSRKYKIFQRKFKVGSSNLSRKDYTGSLDRCV